MTLYLSNARILKLAPWLVLALFILQAAISTRLENWIHPEPFEVVKTQKMDARVSSAVRALAILSGYKVLVGHVFWIHVAQYYGDTDNSKNRYAYMYDFCSIASDLNPQIIPIYTFGAAVLAFHVKRSDEAFRLLQKGIRSNPKEMSLKLMYGAIAYEHAEQYEKVIPFLENELLRPDAPTMLGNILANAYQKAGRYEDSIKMWKKVLNKSESPDLRIEAARKLQGLYSLTKGKNK